MHYFMQFKFLNICKSLFRTLYRYYNFQLVKHYDATLNLFTIASDAPDYYVIAIYSSNVTDLLTGF